MAATAAEPLVAPPTRPRPGPAKTAAALSAMPEPTANLTQILSLASAGDRSAAARLFPLVYDELRELAKRYFQQQSPAHTLQPTALVHEAYVKLIDSEKAGYNDRAHFLATAATAMRQILVDHARARLSAKRGGDRRHIALDAALAETPAPGGSAGRASEVDLLEVDDVLSKLAAIDPRKARIVELRVFGGLACAETASVLDMPVKTAEAHWYAARALLRRELSGGDDD
jgi:RNA polymerase sigma-70 factor, ECF subfamily